MSELSLLSGVNRTSRLRPPTSEEAEVELRVRQVSFRPNPEIALTKN